MTSSASLNSGCGSSGGSCGCSSSGASAGLSAAGAAPLSTPQELPTASINGIDLHPAGQRPFEDELRERAYAELLRQRAVAQGLLAPHDGDLAPELGEAERQVLEAMVDTDVHSPQPQEDECQRYYESHTAQLTVGQALHVRHILFASRFGFHIVEVLERKAGVQPAYAEVRERIGHQLAMQSRARALHQYMTLLAGEAELQNIALDAADSPLVQ